MHLIVKLSQFYAFSIFISKSWDLKEGGVTASSSLTRWTFAIRQLCIPTSQSKHPPPSFHTSFHPDLPRYPCPTSLHHPLPRPSLLAPSNMSAPAKGLGEDGGDGYICVCKGGVSVCCAYCLPPPPHFGCYPSVNKSKCVSFCHTCAPPLTVLSVNTGEALCVWVQK